jgi:hypothetical protein
MKTSDTITKISSALVKAQGELNAVSKDGKNPHFGKKYATMQNIVESTRETLRKHGLAIVQSFDETDGTYINLDTTLLHESGEWMCGRLTLRPDKTDPQRMGSAATYARRYAYSAILGIVTDEDDDGNASSQPSRDRGLETKYEAQTASPELPWLNAVGKNGNFTVTGNKIIQRFLDDPTMDWVKVAEHYRISKEDRKAIDNAVVEAKMVSSVIPSEVEA